jgi:signal transduction histidine kinase
MTNEATKNDSRSTSAKLLVATPSSTFAAQQLDIALGRIFSLALLLSAVETAINAFGQAHFLNPWVFWPIISLVLGSVVGMVLSNWFFSASRFWYVLHFSAILLALLTWNIQLENAKVLPANFTPWPWWQLGISTMSAGFALSVGLAAFSIIAIPAYFGMLLLTPMGGSATVLEATQDAVYSILFSATFVSVVYLLRYRARKQDEANALQQEEAVQAATSEAAEYERVYLASMLHNKVLNALSLAGEARSKAEQTRAQGVAAEALAELQNLNEWPEQQEHSVSADSLFSALTNAVRQQAPSFEVSTSLRQNIEIPMDVATAITEATVQAVNNSLIHAGGHSVHRELVLKTNVNGALKVVVADRGRGFRPARVPKNRMGIKTLIMRRMESVGGQAKIDSEPGAGANVILTWSANG